MVISFYLVLIINVIIVIACFVFTRNDKGYEAFLHPLSSPWIRKDNAKTGTPVIFLSQIESGTIGFT